MLGKIWVNKWYLCKKASAWTMGIYAFLGLIGTFVSLGSLFPDDWSLINCAISSVAILALIWTSCFVISAYLVIKKQRYKILELNNNCHVYVQYGNLFSPDEVINPSERRNVIIPVNRCFDTNVDDDLVSHKSLHGMAFQKLYDQGLYTADSLNMEIQKNLKEHKIPYETVERSEKRRGNLKRYPAGSVAEIAVSDKCHYFLLGLSTFDYKLKATTTDADFVLSLIRMLEFCNERSQNYPVVMPIIGGGLSRTKKSERVILEYLIKLIKLNKELVCSDLHIVVRETAKNGIPIADLKE